MPGLTEPSEQAEPKPARAGQWGWLQGVDWRARGRWFAAEYLIIVFGVLTAAAVNSAWKDRQDRHREAVYLQQLASDLYLTIANLDEIDSYNAPLEMASAKLLRAFQMPEAPPRDSLLFWLDELIQGGKPSPIVTTAAALVATGDLALLSDSLQVLVPGYVAFIDQFQGYIDGNSQQRNASLSALGQHADFVEAYRTAGRMGREHSYDRDFNSPVPEWVVRTAFPLDVSSFLANRQAYGHLRGSTAGCTS